MDEAVEPVGDEIEGSAELFQVPIAEVGHQLASGLLAFCRHLGHCPVAEFGEGDQQGAPVRRMRTTLDEPAGLKGIDLAGHVTRADLERGCQRLLGRRSDLMELPEQMRSGRREPGRGEG